MLEKDEIFIPYVITCYFCHTLNDYICFYKNTNLVCKPRNTDEK